MKQCKIKAHEDNRQEYAIPVDMQDLSPFCPSTVFDNYTTNLCPCGYPNHPDKECVCGPGVVKRYVSKISGPLLDRIDLHVEVTPVSYEMLTSRQDIKGGAHGGGSGGQRGYPD